MKHFLITGYILATILVAIGEYYAITKNQGYLNHIVWGGLAAWNASVIFGFLQRSMWAKFMIKIGSYFQLVVVTVGFIAYVTGIGYSMEFNDQNVTLIGSVLIVLWAIFKLSATSKHYANT